MPEARSQASLDAAAAALAAGFHDLTGDWPITTERVGPRIATLVSHGSTRHDMLVEKGKIGRVIGPQGTTLKALTQNTQCEIFVLDKEGPPPGCGMDQRLIVLLGTSSTVSHAAAEVIPPQPPPPLL